MFHITLSTALTQAAGKLDTAGAVLGLMCYFLLAIMNGMMGFIHNGTAWVMPLSVVILALSCIWVNG